MVTYCSLLSSPYSSHKRTYKPFSLHSLSLSMRNTNCCHGQPGRSKNGKNNTERERAREKERKEERGRLRLSYQLVLSIVYMLYVPR